MNRESEMSRMEGRRGGFVLISVLWILAILTVVAMGFGKRAMMERQMARYVLDHQIALQLARGAVESAIVELINRNVVNRRDGSRGYTSTAQRWAQPVDLFRETEFYTPLEEDFIDEICQYRIYDCESRISINHASRDVLIRVPGLGLNGIRQSTRGRIQTQRFLTLNDLRTVQNIEDDVWFGKESGAGLRDLLTVWGDRGGLININTASPEVLRTIPNLRANAIEAIVLYRAGPDRKLGTRDDRAFNRLEDIVPRTGLRAGSVSTLYKYCKTKSQLFTIEAVATRRHGKIKAYVTASVDFRLGTLILEWREDSIET